MTKAPRAAKPKPRRKPAAPRKAKAPAVPDVKTPEKLEEIANKRNGVGAYRLAPQVRPEQIAKHEPGLPTSPPDLLARPEPSVGLGGPVMIRMVHPEPDASADGFEAHPAGGIWVPHPEVELMKAQGFLVEYADDGPAE